MGRPSHSANGKRFVSFYQIGYGQCRLGKSVKIFINECEFPQLPTDRGEGEANGNLGLISETIPRGFYLSNQVVIACVPICLVMGYFVGCVIPRGKVSYHPLPVMRPEPIILFGKLSTECFAFEFGMDGSNLQPFLTGNLTLK